MFCCSNKVGGGFWRRGGETPSAVKWEDRIIEIREGFWSYIAGSIGRAPVFCWETTTMVLLMMRNARQHFQSTEKVVGTATPKEPTAECQAAWLFSTGDELMISGESLSLSSGLKFTLRSQTSPDSSLILLRGRKMQYRGRKISLESKDPGKQNKEECKEDNEAEVEEEDDEGFVTLTQLTEENPTGKVTALLNWKLLVIEVLPEEDAGLVLLLCISILRSVSEMRKEDLGSLLIRTRLKETKLGIRERGSVILHPSSSSSITSPYIHPWYWNAKTVMAGGTNYIANQPALKYSLAEGDDKLYKRGIITLVYIVSETSIFIQKMAKAIHKLRII